MGDDKRTDPLEVAIHVIIILVGVITLVLAYYIRDDFWNSLMVNVGSSLVVVTLVFGIFEAFRRKRTGREHAPNLGAETPLNQDRSADELISTLRANQQSSITADSSKTGRREA